MAAPTPTARQAPSGIMLIEGAFSKVTPASIPAAGFWEIEVTPFAVSVPMIDNTTMHNVAVRTKVPGALRENKAFKTRVAYDPKFRDDMRSLIGVKDTYTIKYWDGSTEAIYATMTDMEPQPLKIGDLPMADLTFMPTNIDSSRTERDYVVTNVSGT